MNVTTINPTTEQVIKEYHAMGQQEVEKIVKDSASSFRDWKKDIHKRVELLHKFANSLRSKKRELALVATEEMGKPIRESISEIEKCAWVIEYYADNGPAFLNDEVINTDARKSVVVFEPLGVIASIMPWNFPYWQALRFAAPSLVLGNTIVLKPASATLQCGIEMEKLFSDTGFPSGVFQTLVGDSSSAKHLLDSKAISAVTFTGSTSAGSKVAQSASANLKKCVLELGGSDPFIVCEDADVEKAADGAVKGRFINCGQSCIASKRFFVAKNVANEFLEKFVSRTEKLRVGDPMNESTEIGPLSTKNGLKLISEQVDDAVEKGAEVLAGGQLIEGKGFFYKPTIIKNISSNMRIYSEETFGPVASVYVVEDERDSIKLANESDFGLGASVWTNDLDKADLFSKSLLCGMVAVNNVLVSDPRVPFGGVKNSGFGRELAKFGMMEFVNIKSIRYYDKLIHDHHVE